MSQGRPNERIQSFLGALLLLGGCAGCFTAQVDELASEAVSSRDAGGASTRDGGQVILRDSGGIPLRDGGEVATRDGGDVAARDGGVACPPYRVDRVNVALMGGEPDNVSPAAANTSADGRLVVFDSVATNLVGNDLNAVGDVFVRDMESAHVQRVSVTPGSTVESDGASGNSRIDSTGRYVAFDSVATNLLAVPVVGGLTQVFLRDRSGGSTALISVATDDTPGNGESQAPSVSDGGAHVAFVSQADNLIPMDGNGSTPDVFVRVVTGQGTSTTELVSVSEGGGSANGPSSVPRVSSSGRYVAFLSSATNLTADFSGPREWHVYLRDRVLMATVLVSREMGGDPANAASGAGTVSADERFVVFSSEASDLVPGDNNQHVDVFRYTIATGGIEMVSVNTAGAAANDDSIAPEVSGDGRYVVFRSSASDLVVADSNQTRDVFVRDMELGVTRRVNLTVDGAQTADVSDAPFISADGSFVVYTTPVPLSREDSNGLRDVYRVGLECFFR